MKKYLLLIAMCISIIAPYKLYAFDLTVGAATWYTWWEYKQKQTITKNFGGLGGTETFTDTDIKPTFLVGPVLSLKFNDDFNLSFIFLTTVSKFNWERSGYEYDFAFTQSNPFTKKGKADRTDTDITLNYRLNDYFKVFAGAKMLHTSNTTGEEFDSYGPGLGLASHFQYLTIYFSLPTCRDSIYGAVRKLKEGKISKSMIMVSTQPCRSRII